IARLQIKESPIRKSRAFLRLELSAFSRQTSVEMWGCIVQRLPQQQNPVGGTSVPNLDLNKHIHG
ncbi:MAG: hypothetical protein CMK65_07635, partial [Pseudoalteromonas sp.]|nr:hypothetical protein [Pseudoalteromonas sp.]